MIYQTLALRVVKWHNIQRRGGDMVSVLDSRAQASKIQDQKKISGMFVFRPIRHNMKPQKVISNLKHLTPLRFRLVTDLTRKNNLAFFFHNRTSIALFSNTEIITMQV